MILHPKVLMNLSTLSVEETKGDKDKKAGIVKVYVEPGGARVTPLIVIATNIAWTE